MTRYAGEYEAATGMALFPGSLNLIMEEPWSMSEAVITIPADRVGRRVHLVPCSVKGHRCFIFRTDMAQRAGGDEHQILELLADVRLRDALGVRDGDVVEVVI